MNLYLVRDENQTARVETVSGVKFEQPVVQHSPTGYEWGYFGSGPADLALNILQFALEQAGYKGKTVPCYRGECFATAFQLHHEFKVEVIAAIPRKGGQIRIEDVQDWLRESGVNL